jgi:hypothetical protein
VTQYVCTISWCRFAAACPAALISNGTGDAIRTSSALQEMKSFIDRAFIITKRSTIPPKLLAERYLRGWAGDSAESAQQGARVDGGRPLETG